MMLTSERRFARRNRDIDTVLVRFSFFRSLLELCYEPMIWLVKSLFARTLSACAEQNDLPLDPSVSSHAGRKLPCSTPAADGGGVQVARRVAFFRHLNSGSQQDLPADGYAGGTCDFRGIVVVAEFGGSRSDRFFA
jgi:hypothetical protein